MRLIRKSIMVMGGFTSTDFTYTGTYTWIDDGIVNGKPSFRIKFLTSGTFTPKKPIVTDIFLLGGGGGGGWGVSSGSGGGGGRTATVPSVTFQAGVAYAITIGAGGAANAAGGWTAIDYFGYSINSGNPGSGAGAYSYSDVAGGAGGSGGGGNGSGVASTYWNGGNGGSNGSNGAYGQSGTAAGGAGQGTTTREFGEASATLYADGGGGAGYYSTKLGGIGGSGLGGRGYGSQGSPTSGQANTGSGGGGAYRGSATAGSGGSGIVVIRNKRT